MENPTKRAKKTPVTGKKAFTVKSFKPFLFSHDPEKVEFKEALRYLDDHGFVVFTVPEKLAVVKETVSSVMEIYFPEFDNTDASSHKKILMIQSVGEAAFNGIAANDFARQARKWTKPIFEKLYTEMGLIQEEDKEMISSYDASLIFSHSSQGGLRWMHANQNPNVKNVPRLEGHVSALGSSVVQGGWCFIPNSHKDTPKALIGLEPGKNADYAGIPIDDPLYDTATILDLPNIPHIVIFKPSLVVSTFKGDFKKKAFDTTMKRLPRCFGSFVTWRPARDVTMKQRENIRTAVIKGRCTNATADVVKSPWPSRYFPKVIHDFPMVLITDENVILPELGL